MNIKVFLIIWSVLCVAQAAVGQESSKRVVCFYDATTGKYQGEPFFFAKNALPRALTYCTHLVYSFAAISPKTFKIQKVVLYPPPSLVKRDFPHLKIFLSVGGDALEHTNHYIKFLGAGEIKQKYFAKYARKILKLQNFDGLDLAFPFPRDQPYQMRTGFEAALSTLKRVFTNDENPDVKAKSLKLQYTKFGNILRQELSKAHLQLSMTVLPNVNSSYYFDIFKIHKHFEFITLLAFDFLTPTRNPTQADYSAPIYFKKAVNRSPCNTIDFQVNHWINNFCPANKLNLGIATYGRSWRLTIDSGLSGVPVVEAANGAADPGKYSKVPGLLSLSEICTKLDAKGTLHEVVDKERRYGSYAFNPADKNNENGIWISFDNPDSAEAKTEYAKEKLMGGVAVYNLQNDDFIKFCGGPVFPVLSRISKVLGTDSVKRP